MNLQSSSPADASWSQDDILLWVSGELAPERAKAFESALAEDAELLERSFAVAELVAQISQAPAVVTSTTLNRSEPSPRFSAWSWICGLAIAAGILGVAVLRSSWISNEESRSTMPLAWTIRLDEAARGPEMPESLTESESLVESESLAGHGPLVEPDSAAEIETLARAALAGIEAVDLGEDETSEPTSWIAAAIRAEQLEQEL